MLKQFVNEELERMSKEVVRWPIVWHYPDFSMEILRMNAKNLKQVSLPPWTCYIRSRIFYCSAVLVSVSVIICYNFRFTADFTLEPTNALLIIYLNWWGRYWSIT